MIVDLDDVAPLRHELEDSHEYEFVEASVKAPMSEGESTLSLCHSFLCADNHQLDVEALSTPGSSCYAFYNPEDLSSLRNSINQLNEYVLAEGPFDAVMGFSGGAVLAAMYLMEQQLRQDRGDVKAELPFKCGIFLASASCRSEASVLGTDVQEVDKGLIRIPTVHIWGSNDMVAPTGGEDLSKMCDPAQRTTLVHDGRHEVPRKNHLTESVHVIRRALHLIETRQGAYN